MRVTARLPEGAIIGDKYFVEKSLSSDEEENNLKYIAYDVHNSEHRVFIRELVFDISSEKTKTKIVEPLLERLLRLVKVKHENIVPLVNVYSEEEKAFKKYRVYVISQLETSDWTTLADIIEKEPDKLTEHFVKDISIQIGSVLQHLHNLEPDPIIYYDLNPENIIVTKEGKVKLLDYGSTRTLEKDFSINQNMGTPGYSAPEQYGIKPVDKRADIYGFGAILHQMVTREDPKKNPLKFERVKKLVPECNRRIANLITMCLESKPEDRVQTIEEIIEKLEKISDSPASTVTIKKKETEATEEKKPKKVALAPGQVSGMSGSIKFLFAKYSAQISAIGALLLITLVVLAVLNTISSKQQEHVKMIIIGQDSKDILTMDIQKNLLLEPAETREKTSENGILTRDNEYVYIASTTDYLLCLELDTNKVVSKIDVGGTPGGMANSPVQNYLAVSVTDKNNILIIDTAFNKTVAKLKSGGSNPVSLCFSDNGEEIFVANKGSRNIAVMDTAGKIISEIDCKGEPVDIINSGVENKYYVALWDTNEIIVIDGEEKQILKRIAIAEGPKQLAYSREERMIAVNCVKSKEVVFISTIEESVKNKVSFKDMPCSITYSSDGTSLYVGTSSFDQAINNIFIIKGDTPEKLVSLKNIPGKLVLTENPEKK